MSGLVDSLPITDLTARHLSYNNTTDRMKVELPPAGDAAASGLVQTIDVDRQSRLDGTTYSVSWKWPNTVSGEEKGFLICGREHESYNRILLSTSGDWEYELWENPTVTASGSEVPKFNFMRHIGSASGTLFVDYYADPTISASGTNKIYESRTGDSFLATANPDKFWGLDRSTDYYLWFKNYGNGPSASGLALNVEVRKI